jgi:DNA-binding CsgD family transcriptional regulator
LGLSAKTVETHCASIKRKLSLPNAHHLFQAAARWEQAGRV